MLKKLFTHFLDAEPLKIDLKFCVKFVCHLAFFSFYYYYGTLMWELKLIQFEGLF